MALTGRTTNGLPYAVKADQFIPSSDTGQMMGEVDSQIAGKAPLDHQHTMEQVAGLDTALEDRPRKVESMRWLGQMAAGASWDQLLTRGWREWTKPDAASYAGKPAGVTEQGILETIYGLSTWTMFQRATEALTGRMWIRLIRNPGTFQWWPWREVAFTDMLTASVGGTTRLAADWLHVGDSLTDDVALGSSQWTRVLAGLTGRAHETRGWYNQRTFEIAARMGATLYPVTVAGGSIPSTASVTVTGQRAQQLAFGGYAGLMSRKIPGWLAGRHGTLRNPDNGSAMVFTPDDGKPATSVSGTVWFEGDMTPHLGRVVTIWAGTNDRTTSSPTELVEMIRGMLARVPHGRALVMGLMPDPNGTASTQITAINAAYRAEWPDLYFDPGVALMTAQAATDAGITYTAQDQADIAAGHVPGSFRSDSIHLNADGARALARAVYRDAIARGWTLPGNGEAGARQQLPPLPAPPVAVGDVTGLSDRLGGLEYDSGWRNVSESLEAGISGNVFISRGGDQVHMMFHNVHTTTEGTRNIYTLPPGYRPTSVSGANWRNGTLATDNGDTVRQASFYNNRMRILSMPTGKLLGGYIVFRVPTTLPPGTPPGAAA